MSAQERQDALLRQLAVADDAASDVFFTSSFQQGALLFHDGLPGRQIPVGVGDVKALDRRGLLSITEFREQGDVAFVLTPEGHAYASRTELADPSGDSVVPGQGAPQPVEKVIRQRAFDHWIQTGSWPAVGDMQKDSARRREGTDIAQVARGLDRATGWVEPQDQTLVLRVKGFADLDGAQPYLDAFVRVVGLLHDRYLSEDKDARLTDEDLRREGFDDDMVRRLYLVVDREWFLFGGGSGDETGAWSREPSTNIWRFAEIRDVDDYLRVVAELTRPYSPEAPAGFMEVPEPVAPAPGGEPGAAAERSSAIPGFELLHPDILKVSAGLFANGHHAQAVFEALKAVEVRVKAVSGLSDTGQKLVSAAFNKESPKIVLPIMAPEMAADEKEAFRFLFMGTIWLRNVFAHDFPEPDERLTADYLALASLLLGRLDQVTRA
jgi:uncharacterized protein (TIGR02391 family)